MRQNPKPAALTAAGVFVWRDDLSRDRLSTGDLAELIDTMGVVGVTTNPTMFQHPRSKGYADEQIRELAGRGADVDAAVRTITTDGIREACEVLHRQWEASDGVDGLVSTEVDPRLADDTDKTVARAVALWKIVDHPNLMIKSTATLAGLEAAKAVGHDIVKIHSVASCFVSRVDTETDKRLEKIGATEAGARRPLWASTGVKNPNYPDTMYVTELVARNTVSTMPEQTLHAVADLGVIKGGTATGRAAEAHEHFDKLQSVGVDLPDVFLVLENEGVEKFQTSWHELLTVTQTELDAAGTQQSCRAGEFGGDRR
jgi:transaldolase